MLSLIFLYIFGDSLGKILFCSVRQEIDIFSVCLLLVYFSHFIGN